MTWQATAGRFSWLSTLCFTLYFSIPHFIASITNVKQLPVFASLKKKKRIIWLFAPGAAGKSRGIFKGETEKKNLWKLKFAQYCPVQTDRQTVRQTHTYTHTPTHAANRPVDGLILAADIVIKQLNHWQAPRRNCTRARVWFQRHVFAKAPRVQLHRAHKHTPYWHGSPSPCIFLRSRKALGPIMRKSIKFLFCWVVLQCGCVWVCVHACARLVEQAFMDVGYIKHHHQPPD